MVELVHKFGPKRWSLIAQQIKGRIGKQCRERSDSLFFCAAVMRVQLAQPSQSGCEKGCVV